MQKKSQIDKFRETARELGADEDESKFEATLRKVAKGEPKALDEMADKLGQKDPNVSFGKVKKPR
jgi:DNA-binding transcriptional regulator GbsR (MarR family)